MKIDSTEILRTIYKLPSERAIKKDIKHLDIHATRFIEMSPFCIISTFNSAGKVDVSPRGGNKGFVKVLNENSLLIPDASGNNRLDCLTNIIDTSRIGMLLFIPGIDETLRVNGKAEITTDGKIFELFEKDDFKYKSVIQVEIEEVFLHCAKALMRSKLWDDSIKMSEDNLPSMGEMLKDQMKLDTSAETRDESRNRYLKEL